MMDTFPIESHIVSVVDEDIRKQSFIEPFSIRVWDRRSDRPSCFGEFITKLPVNSETEVGRFCQKLFDASLSQSVVDFRRNLLVSESEFDDIKIPALVTGYDIFFDYSDDHGTNVDAKLVETLAHALRVGLGIGRENGA